jgi:hypothetical protein
MKATVVAECFRFQTILISANEEHDILQHSPNTIRAIKSRRLGWAGHVAKMEEDMSAFKTVTGKPAANIDGRTMLSWVFEKWMST